MDQTLDYYNENAKEFTSGTVSVDFEGMQLNFVRRLPKGARILDFGCGSGRDAKFFLEKGFEVEARDGSSKLCAYASEYTGLKVRVQLFQELDDVNRFDGIWACSSILHLNKEELAKVLKKMSIALKQGGIIYTSFKYGEFEGMRNGRYFTDMTEGQIENMLREIKELTIEEEWVTADVRPGRGGEKWLNLILRKE